MKNILNKNGIICALDIGTYTTKCLLARQISNDKIVLLGHGICKTNGMNKSEVSNSELLTETIKKVVETAEKQANEKIENVIVSVGSSEMKSTIEHEDKIFNNQMITKQDISRLQNKIVNRVQNENEKNNEINIHTFFVCYDLDGNARQNAPINLFGEKLSMYYNSIFTKKFFVQNLKTSVETSLLNTSKFVAAPLMAGLASLKKEELENGTLVIDFGAGSTGISFFQENQNYVCEKINFGSADITERIKRELKINRQDAENIKIKYGSCLNNQSYRDIEIKVYPVGIKDNNSLITKTKYDISEIIISEIDILFNKIKKIIDDREIQANISEIVLVGNGCLLEGFRERLSLFLENQNCRFGEPVHIPCGQKVIDSKIKNSFMNCFGIIYYTTHELLKNEPTKKSGPKPNNRLQKIWQFFSNI
ncbi:MAG: cell division protein FtsA [Alphaproteobacteria bacterium]|nr:cell division protein FtsA [Alphaproteobacteria bacterium]